MKEFARWVANGLLFVAVGFVVAIGLAAGVAFSGCSNPHSSHPDEAEPDLTPFDTSTAGLPEAKLTHFVDLQDGDTLRLSVSYVAKEIAGRRVRMLAYAGAVPGPTYRLKQGAQITVLLRNESRLPQTLHSHGVRMDYRFDGVPGITPLADSGETVTYTLRFDDPGFFWYHPHVREDYQMELGLYGGYLVAPRDSTYWDPVNRDMVLMLDDIRLDDAGITPYPVNNSERTLMGRFGNVFFVNGESPPVLRVKRLETLRVHVLNAASARVFRLQFSRDMDMHIVGADHGRFEFASAREEYLIGPSERLIFQMHMQDKLDDYDTLDLLNVTPAGTGVLARIVYDPDTAEVNYRSSLHFEKNEAVSRAFDPYREALLNPPDEEILLTGFMDMREDHDGHEGGAGHVMKRAASQHDPDPENTLGIEWSDSSYGNEMRGMNDMSNLKNTSWIIRDLKTGKENHAIQWRFKKGSLVMIRVRNDSTTSPLSQLGGADIMLHPMPHPIHFHGQRFLVARENGQAPKQGLVWRDSYLIGRGYTVDLLLDAANAGEWMFHCHIGEHLMASMMGHFSVVGDTAEFPEVKTWALSLSGALNMPKTRLDTTVILNGGDSATGAARALSGEVHGFDASVMADTLYARLGSPGATVWERVALPLDAQGRFELTAEEATEKVTGLWSQGLGMGAVHFHLREKSAKPNYRFAPDTLRVMVDKRPAWAWSLDLAWPDGTEVLGLKGDTVLSVRVNDGSTGEPRVLAGKVQGLDAGRNAVAPNGIDAFIDTLYIRNRTYVEYFAAVPLAEDGSFEVPAEDVMGVIDGLHRIEFNLRGRNGQGRIDPLKMVVTLDVL
jgi:suppressor of ftsI